MVVFPWMKVRPIRNRKANRGGKHFPIECGVASETWRHGPNSFKHVSFWCSLCDPHQTTHQSNEDFRWRKVTESHPRTFDTWRWPQSPRNLSLPIPNTTAFRVSVHSWNSAARRLVAGIRWGTAFLVALSFSFRSYEGHLRVLMAMVQRTNI